MSVQSFRKKPVTIQAIQWTGENTKEVLDFIGRQITVGQVNMFTGKVVDMDIPTLEGTMKATVGDWIIKGVKGEFYPCKPDIFEQTYECVSEPTDFLKAYSISYLDADQNGSYRNECTCIHAVNLKTAILQFLDRNPNITDIVSTSCLEPSSGG